MRNILAIIHRELKAYFASPIAYIVLAIFILVTGFYFKEVLGRRRDFVPAKTESKER